MLEDTKMMWVLLVYAYFFENISNKLSPKFNK